jgi:hypothetical protein
MNGQALNKSKDLIAVTSIYFNILMFWRLVKLAQYEFPYLHMPQSPVPSWSCTWSPEQMSALNADSVVGHVLELSTQCFLALITL